MEILPVNEVPAVIVPTTEDEMVEVSGILDKDSRNQIEQLLLTCLQAMCDHMANVLTDVNSDEADDDGRESEGAHNGEDSVDDDNDATEGEVSRMVAAELGESLEPLRARMDEQFNAVAWDIKREISKRYGIEPESRFECPIPDDPGTVDFILPRGKFDAGFIGATGGLSGFRKAWTLQKCHS
ncbi:hypothetical protein BGZ68_004251 [Mortierella alpina]|nr:hypothetical protein BGZ68_004251 [Mortierella alpina]